MNQHRLVPVHRRYIDDTDIWLAQNRIQVMFCVFGGDVRAQQLYMCYTEKAPNAWHRRGTQRTGNTYNQPKRPSTDTTHRPSTWQYPKGSPGVKTHNTNQHSNHSPSVPTRNWVITRSSQPTQPVLRSGLSRTTTQTSPASAGTHIAALGPRLWGPHQEWPTDSPGRTA